jgi:hypothetical protein
LQYRFLHYPCSHILQYHFLHYPCSHILQYHFLNYPCSHILQYRFFFKVIFMFHSANYLSSNFKYQNHSSPSLEKYSCSS